MISWHVSHGMAVSPDGVRKQPVTIDQLRCIARSLEDQPQHSDNSFRTSGFDLRYDPRKRSRLQASTSQTPAWKGEAPLKEGHGA